AGVDADERLLERDGSGSMLRDEAGDRVEDRLQPQLRPFSGARLPPPVVDGPEAPVAFVDDAVPARSRPWIDADDLHGQRLGSDPDVSSPRIRPSSGHLNIPFTKGLDQALNQGPQGGLPRRVLVRTRECRFEKSYNAGSGVRVRALIWLETSMRRSRPTWVRSPPRLTCR